MQKEEQQKYEAMWGHDAYRLSSPGCEAAACFLTHFGPKIEQGDAVIDFGCGTGRAGAFFLSQGFNVRLVDIAANCLDENVASLTALFPQEIVFVNGCLWDLPASLESAAWAYCCDVLEHLPQAHIDAALFQMAQRTKKGGFFQIFLKDEPFGLMIGKRLHLTIQPKEWWIEKISAHWAIEDFGPEIPGSRFTVFVRPKNCLQ